MVNKEISGAGVLGQILTYLSRLSRERSTDNLALSGEYSESRYRDFERTAFHNYESGDKIRIFADEAYREVIEESDIIHEESVNFLQSGAESSQILEILDNSVKGDRTMVYADNEYIKELEKLIGDKLNIDTFNF